MSPVFSGSEQTLSERFLSHGQALQDLIAGGTPPTPEAFAAFYQKVLADASLLAQLGQANLERAHADLDRRAAEVQAVEATPALLPGKLLRREDVADYLGVSLRFVDELVSRGELVPVRIGRNVRFHPGAVEAFVRASARGEAPGLPHRRTRRSSKKAGRHAPATGQHVPATGEGAGEVTP